MTLLTTKQRWRRLSDRQENKIHDARRHQKCALVFALSMSLAAPAWDAPSAAEMMEMLKTVDERTENNGDY